jgi:DNA-binding CsgD family transcriptional regulator
MTVDPFSRAGVLTPVPRSIHDPPESPQHEGGARPHEPGPPPARSAAALALLDVARTLDPDSPRGPAGLLEPLRAALSADEVGIFGLTPRGGALAIDFAHFTPGLATFRDRGEALLSRDAPRAALFDPFAPDEDQQNVPLTFRELVGRPNAPAAAAHAFLESCGLGGMDVLRALVCFRGEVLEYVAAFRREPFGAVERELLAELLPVLRDRAAIERRLREGGFAHAGLPAALDAVTGAAFLVRDGGVVLLANEAGRRLLAREPSVRGLLADPAGGHRFAVTRLALAGLPPAWLAVERSGVASHQARLETAAARWRLTPRESDVLARLARGTCNKDMGVALGCAEATVERHVTAILQKSGCTHRAEVVARFWTEP